MGPTTSPWAYDGLERLTALSGTLFTGESSSETFAYDAATNLTARTGPAATYAIDGSNRVTSDGARAFTWSGADRLVQRGTDIFAYDPLGRMTSSSVGAAPVTRTYAYDGDGLLRSRTQNAATTSFLWDSSVAPAPLLVAGSDRVVHGLGPLYIARANGSTLTLVRDALGSVRAEVTDQGLIAKAFRYAAYGEIAQASPLGATPTLLGFTGELRDPSGLIYLRARWYDPGTGRFTTSDPLAGRPGKPASLNAFAYTHGRPTFAVDPAGLDPAAPERFQDIASWLPDYYKFSLNVAIPNPLTLTFVGVSFALTVDRYGHLYAGIGPSVGKTATVVSGSAVGGYIVQSTVPSPAQASSYVSNWTVSAGGGFIVGANATLSPGADGQKWAVEPGLFSPQAGVNATYSWLLR